MKCKHENIHITEYYKKFTFHSIKDGVITTEWNDDLKSEVVEVFVLCDGCGFVRSYKSRLPQWLQDRMQAIHENEYKRIEAKSYEGIRGTT